MMKHILLFAANDGDSGGGSSGGGGDSFEDAAELRDRAKKMAAKLAWHVENTPLATWRKAIPANNLRGHCALLHALHDNRPKRPASPAETAEIARLLVKMMREAPADLLQLLATDPDWHIFQLRLDFDPPTPDGEI